MSNSARIVAAIGAAIVVAAASFGCAGLKNSSTAQATPDPAPPYHASADNTTGQSPTVVAASNSAPSNNSGYTGDTNRSYTVADNSRRMDQERAAKADRN